MLTFLSLDSALMRQVLYGTTRLGLYKVFVDMVAKKKGRAANFIESSACSLSSGALAALIGNPTDLILVRMQNDSNLKRPRNYKNVFEAAARIAKEEGLLTLWRGTVPTMFRAMAMNIGMMTSYDMIKQSVNNYLPDNSKDGLQARIMFETSFLSFTTLFLCC